MSPLKHLFFITVSDVQRVAEEIINRKLNDGEVEKVVELILDRIQWYDPLVQSIMDVVNPPKVRI